MCASSHLKGGPVAGYNKTSFFVNAESEQGLKSEDN